MDHWEDLAICHQQSVNPVLRGQVVTRQPWLNTGFQTTEADKRYSSPKLVDISYGMFQVQGLAAYSISFER